MKKIYLLLLLLTGLANAQIVVIPDPVFKNALLGLQIDTNMDGEIQVSEAEAVTVIGFTPPPQGITDLTGIQAFVNLEELYISSQLLTSLDVSGLSHLTYLDCQSNQLQSLNVSGTNLTNLYCGDNQLTSLDLSGLTTLNDLYCYNNLLSVLNLNGLSGLERVLCEDNQLTSLIVDDVPLLQTISCGRNQLASLNMQNLPLLRILNCTGNLFTTLDISHNPNICLFECGNNLNLISVNMKNGPEVCGEISDFNNNPNLQYVCTDEAEVSQLINYFGSLGMNVNVNTYCSFEPGGNYNTISGNVRFDSDNNGCDNDDLIFDNVKVSLTHGTESYSTFTNNGNYKFYTQDGSYSVSAAVENPAYFIINPTSSVFNFPSANNTTITQNFCIIPNGTHQDLEIVIAPITPARPGFEAIYQIVYRNKGNTVMSLDYGVSFFYNQHLMSFVSADITPSTIGPGGLSWNYSNLKPFESRSILVTMQINPPTDLVNPVNIGDELVFNSSVGPVGSDETQIDNYGILKQIVVGSFDPNDIQCLEGDVLSPAEIGKYLHYLIRFENTGTAAAENIVVKAEINPEDFDVNSLQLLNASHPTDTRVKGNVAEFIFKNIMLESGGHGNILLKVKSKNSLITGDSVHKKANIFFDYNFPILTNEAETVFQTLSTGEIEKQFAVKIYPNPTENILNVKGGKIIKSIQLFDVQGRILMTKIVNGTQAIIETSPYSSGTYFIRMQTENGTFTQKIVKK